MFETPEMIIIPVHPPVTDEMKRYNIEGQPYKGMMGELSEWAARMALHDFPVGTLQKLEEVVERAQQHPLDIVLLQMVDNGLLDMSWDDEKEEMVFGLTPGGKEWHKGLEMEFYGDA